MTPSDPLTEHELDRLVSIAIRSAEALADELSPAADDAWRDVLGYERQLAAVTSPESVPGGLARVGGVAAALAAGDSAQAAELAARYLAEPALPDERREAILRLLEP